MSRTKSEEPRVYCIRCELSFWAIDPLTEKKRKLCPLCQRKLIPTEPHHGKEFNAKTPRVDEGEG